MGSLLRSSIALLVRYLAAAALVVVAFVPAPAAVAATSARQAAPQSWVVEKARFEPLDTDGSLSAEGLGAYRGAIDVTAGPAGLAVVNEVRLDDYVRGISEVPATWPAAALEAQAIAARTFVLNQKVATVTTAWRAAGADVCASDACQVYSGVAAEQRTEGARWVQAVEATSGQVLLADGRPILAKYSSSNGGRSVSGGARYLRAVDDPDDATSPLHRWDYSRPLSEIAAALGIDPPERLLGLDRRGNEVVLGLRLGSPDSLDMVEERVPTTAFVATVNSRLPPPPSLPLPLPSWQFSFETSGANVVIHGRGHGHGIGLSQYGALGRARRGQSASDIVAAYYGGIRPTMLADPQAGNIRVALSLDRPDASVSSPRYFRIVDGAGNVLAPAALGHWRVVPADKGVRVIAPEGHDAPISLNATAVEPAEPGPGDITVLRFSISAPAMLTVQFTPPGLAPGANPSRLVEAGEVVELLPSPGVSGDYQVTLQADAGPGRQASLPIRFRATASPGTVATAAADAPVATGRVVLAAATTPVDHRWTALSGLTALVTLAAFALLLATRRPRPVAGPAALATPPGPAVDQGDESSAVDD